MRGAGATVGESYQNPSPARFARALSQGRGLSTRGRTLAEPADTPLPDPSPPDTLLDRLCRWLALAGGLLLAAAALVTSASVLRRYFLGDAIGGDVEIVTLLTAMAVSLFLPWCQLRKGNVIVDVFTERAGPRTRALLDALGSLALAVLAGLIAWRMALGGLDLRRAHDESMVLRIPTWWPFVVIVPCFALLCLCGLVGLARELRTGGRR